LPKTEIYHSLHAPIPPSNRFKKILTVHDCRFLAFPELYSSQTVEWYRRLMNNSFERADIVTTVSRFTRQEILAHFTIPEDRIKVIHNGFSPYVPAASDCRKKVRRFMQKHNLPKDYLLFVGVLDPRKNLGRLLEALSNLKQENKDFPDMVIAGISPRRWAKSDQAKKMTNIGLSKHIHVIGVVARDILFGITQKALALCYPSLYEGFGFPPLEAMSQGIPVFAGKSSSIPEVTGDAACLVDPLSIDDMVRGLHRIVYDKEYRQKLIERGFDQINRFSWSKAATEYIQLYKKVLD
jgi:glycosyltransferase involved in cell wall biosynthesis